MNIVYLVFGRDISYYQQVFFSVYTAFLTKSESDRIIILTEDASFFKQIESYVTIIPLDKALLTEWQGSYGYFFRLKIKALEYVAKEYPNQNLLYLDGDTFIYNSLVSIKEELDKGSTIMHVNEGFLAQLPTKSEKKMWKSLKYKTFAGVYIDEKTAMWNSGVIGISAKYLETISLALNICDEMCLANIEYFTKEQLAFALAGSTFTTIQPADHVIGHYWGNKDEWDEIISTWMKQSLMRNYSFTEMLDEVAKIPFDQIPFYYRHSNTYKRLSKQLKNKFKPKKNPLFIQK